MVWRSGKSQRHKGVIAVMLITFCAAVVLGIGLLWYQQQQARRDLQTSLNNTVQFINNEPYTLSVEAKSATEFGPTTISVDGTAKRGSFLGTGKLKVYFGNVPVEVSGSVQSVGQQIYIQPADIEKALDGAIKVDGSIKDYKNYVEALATYNGKWIEVGDKETPEGECSVQPGMLSNDALAKVGSEVKELPGAPKGERKYELQTTVDTLNTFFDHSGNEDSLSNDIPKCISSVGLKGSDSVTVTISINTRELRVTKFVFLGRGSQLTVVIKPADQDKKSFQVTKPSDAVPFSELQKSVENIIGSLPK